MSQMLTRTCLTNFGVHNYGVTKCTIEKYILHNYKVLLVVNVIQGTSHAGVLIQNVGFA